MKTQLAIIGAGAAGLMAAAAAAERGLKPVLIERKHRPGRKILLCGNNRCNLSSDMDVDRMIAAFGEPVGEFLRPALQHFSPEMLRKWFKQNGLPVSVHKDGRIFPSSERADDVLHTFTDLLRSNETAIIYNSPVTAINRTDEGFAIETASLELECSNVIIATGGVSYPKTGSVGDGQKFARELGHKVAPYRPGLVGFVMNEAWLHNHDGSSFMDTLLTITSDGREIGKTCGEILCNKWGLSGPAMVNASRILARRNIKNYEFTVDLKPELSKDEVVKLLVDRTKKRGGKCKLSEVLRNAFIPGDLCKDWIKRVLNMNADVMVTASPGPEIQKIAAVIKQWDLVPEGTRPLKEAMVTVGGVALNEINPQTMESNSCPNLYFAGEVMDIDGPTGGFNLQAAFATARLAVESIAGPGSEKAVKPAKQRLNRNRQRKFNPKRKRRSGGFK